MQTAITHKPRNANQITALQEPAGSIGQSKQRAGSGARADRGRLKRKKAPRLRHVSAPSETVRISRVRWRHLPCLRSEPNGNADRNAPMPALDDIRALRAQRERAQPQSRPAADDTDDDESDDPNVIESGALSHEDEMLAMQGTAPFGSSTPAPARYQEQSAPEASGWTTKHMQALTPIWITHSDEDAEAFCVRFSPDDTLLAAGCGDGVVRVFHTEDGRLAYKLEACASGLPTTAVRFRPTSAASKTRNVLLAANSDGTVQHWHVTSSRCLHTITEEDNQVYALDYAADGLRFATAGKDYTVCDEAVPTHNPPVSPSPLPFAPP